jgi:hypothetical protein
VARDAKADPLDLSSEEKSILDQVSSDWKQGDKEVTKRLLDEIPLLFLKLMAAYWPDALRKAVEDHLIDQGLTNADIRKMIDEALKPN